MLEFTVVVINYTSLKCVHCSLFVVVDYVDYGPGKGKVGVC